MFAKAYIGFSLLLLLCVGLAFWASEHYYQHMLLTPDMEAAATDAHMVKGEYAKVKPQRYFGIGGGFAVFDADGNLLYQDEKTFPYMLDAAEIRCIPDYDDYSFINSYDLDVPQYDGDYLLVKTIYGPDDEDSETELMVLDQGYRVISGAFEADKKKYTEREYRILTGDFPENAELEGFRKRLAADATPDREGLTEALREPDAGEQIRLFEGGDAAGLAAARSRAYSAAFYDACFPEAGSAEQALSRERLRFFYRGAANERYLLAPGVYRTGEKPEDFYFHELQVRCPAPFAGRRYLEKLTYMQHYGAPTRLLDITANPLVALYFACAAEPDCDGKVIVFCVEAADVAYASSDRVQMLSHLPELNQADQRHLEALSYRYMLRPGKFPQKSNQKYDDAVLERLYYDIQKENNAFTRDIRPFDLLRPVFVQSNQDNPRILRQDGAFLLSGLDTDEADSDRKLRKHVLKELRIPAGCKAAIVQQLERVNIHQASLFPEPDTVAQYLRRK